MARPNIADVRQLSGEAIAEQIDATRRELFTLRFEQATRRLEKPHQWPGAGRRRRVEADWMKERLRKPHQHIYDRMELNPAAVKSPRTSGDSPSR